MGYSAPRLPCVGEAEVHGLRDPEMVQNKKRTRRDPATSRTLILDATEKLMVEEGYAAVTTREVARRIGVNSALIHYYYSTIDDLFTALHVRMTERQLSALKDIFDSSDPLSAFWQFQTNWAHSKLGVEFLALANHRPALKKKIVRTTTQARKSQAEGLKSHLTLPKGVAGTASALGIVTLLVGIARMLVNEESIGISVGHAEARRLVAWLMKQIAA
jgi:AcrR family transcriptional regulator